MKIKPIQFKEGVFAQDVDESRGSVEELLNPYDVPDDFNAYDGLSIIGEGEELQLAPEDLSDVYGS